MEKLLRDLETETAKKLQEQEETKVPVYNVIVGPGETVYVPPGWCVGLMPTNGQSASGIRKFLLPVVGAGPLSTMKRQATGEILETASMLLTALAAAKVDTP
eukprot:10069893-Lingulodinium_polyedra.AAC.1